MDPERMNTAARALEDAFFAKENARLLAELRAEARKTERRQAMRDVISIKDKALVDQTLVDVRTITGKAPALDRGERPGLRDASVVPALGQPAVVLRSAVRYYVPIEATSFSPPEIS